MAKYPSQPYRDLILVTGLCIVAAHIMTHYDEEDSVWEAVFTKSYWRGFTASFIIAMLVSLMIRFISSRLDRSYHWIDDTLKRTLLQFFFGVILPCFLTLLLVGVYFAFYGRNILETDYIKEDFIVACLMILTLNVFYFGVSLYYQLRAVAAKPDTEYRKPFRGIIIVDTPKRSIPVKTADISYVYTFEGMVFLRTADMSDMSDSYRLDENLKDYEADLDPEMFFRINRQMIVNINAVMDFQTNSSKTLKITLHPIPYPDENSTPESHKRLTIVAEDRVAAFKNWVKQ